MQKKQTKKTITAGAVDTFLTELEQERDANKK